MTIQVALMPSKDVADFPWYTFSDAAVVSKAWIMNLVHNTNCEDRVKWGRGGEYAQDKLNIHANALSPLLPQSRMHKGGSLQYTK